MKAGRVLAAAMVLAACTSGERADQVAATAQPDPEERRWHEPSLALKCSDGAPWRVTPPTQDGEGAPTPYEAIDVELAPYAQRDGTDILYDGLRGVVTTDGRVVVQSTAVELDDRTWIVHATYGCSDTEPIGQ